MKLTEHITCVGVQAPETDSVDITKSLSHGTTYNAYLVQGEKTVLIETVPAEFAAEYIANIEKIVPVAAIDYVILNHAAPEHAGALAVILEKNPDITVIGTIAALKNLKAITNCEFHELLAKDAQTLDLGGVTLEFLIAPNLPWPDTMFTYLPEEHTLFSCDGFSAHICTATEESEAYQAAFAEFYQENIAPQKEFAKKAVERLGEQNISRICPGHGPVLKAAKTAVQQYSIWSEPENKEQKTAAIFYVSATGYTKAMAEAIREGLEETNVAVQLVDAADCTPEKIQKILQQADGILFGAPTVNRNVPKPLWDVVSCLDAISMQGVPMGVFGACGWSGEACNVLLQHLKALRFPIFETPQKVIFKPSPEDIKNIKVYAKRFADAL